MQTEGDDRRGVDVSVHLRHAATLHLQTGRTITGKPSLPVSTHVLRLVTLDAGETRVVYKPLKSAPS